MSRWSHRLCRGVFRRVIEWAFRPARPLPPPRSRLAALIPVRVLVVSRIHAPSRLVSSRCVKRTTLARAAWRGVVAQERWCGGGGSGARSPTWGTSFHIGYHAHNTMWRFVVISLLDYGCGLSVYAYEAHGYKRTRTLLFAK